VTANGEFLPVAVQIEIRAATKIQPVTSHPSYNLPKFPKKNFKKPTPLSALFPVSDILQKLN